MANLFAIVRLAFMTLLIAVLTVIFALTTFVQFFIQPVNAKGNWANIARVWSGLAFTWKGVFNDKLENLKRKRAEEQAAYEAKLANQPAFQRPARRSYVYQPCYSYYEPEELLIMTLGLFYVAIPVVAISSVIYSAIVYTVYVQNAPVIQPETSVVQETKQTFEETEHDKVERELCPCTQLYEMDKAVFETPSFAAMAIVDGAGHIRFSNKWTAKPVEFKPFKGAQEFKIIANKGADKHRVTFMWKDDEYTVNAEQPFRLGQDGYFTYKFTLSKTLVVAESSAVEFTEMVAMK